LVRRRTELHHPPVEGTPWKKRLPAKSHVQCQPTAHVIVVLKIEPVEIVAVHKELTAALRELIDLSQQERGGSVFRDGSVESEVSWNVRVISDIVELSLDRAAH